MGLIYIYPLVATSFSCVDIDIECKNISKSSDIGKIILSTKKSKSRIPKKLGVVCVQGHGLTMM